MPRSVSLSLTTVLTLLLCARASAAAMAPAPMPIPLPSVRIDGPAQIDERRVQVRCLELAIDSYACDVEVGFRLTTTEPTSLHLLGDASWVVRGAGLEPSSDRDVELSAMGGGMDPVTGEPTEGASRIVEVVVRFRRALSVRTVSREDFWVLVPLRGRHLLLGDGGDVHREGGDAYGELISGSQVVFSGELSADVQGPDAVAVNIAGHTIDGRARVPAPHSGLLIAVIPEPEEEPSVIQHGGPVLAAGVRLGLNEEDDGRFLLRAAYELALEGHFIGSVSFETDFESIYESIVIEAASPELLIIVPSLSAGVGLVARQLGNRDANAGLRLRVGMNFIAIGVTCDFDYWPTTGHWTGMVVGRVSL